jgi:hypothetical protein
MFLDSAHGQALTMYPAITMIGRKSTFVALTAGERVAEKNSNNSITKKANTTIMPAS